MNTNAYYLPNCLSCSVVTSPIEAIVNTDCLLLLSHLADGYLYAWRGMPAEEDCRTVCCSSDRILFVNNTCFDLFVSQLFTDEMVSLPRCVLRVLLRCRSTSVPYSYKLPTTLHHDAPIVRFALTAQKEGSGAREAGAWSKGINIHSFSLEKEECIKLYLETRNGADAEQGYETVFLSVKNTLLQTTVTLFSPMRVLSLLSTPIEVQLRNETREGDAVTPATTSLLCYLHNVEHPEDRNAAPIYYSPFPFTMVNHFDFYDKEREENQNHVYIRLRSKAAGIWGNWLRIPDVYYGQDYRLCRIHIPIDSENNFNYCYLVNRYSDETKANLIELLPSMVFVNETEEELYFKHYINEGRIGCRRDEKVEQID